MGQGRRTRAATQRPELGVLCHPEHTIEQRSAKKFVDCSKNGKLRSVKWPSAAQSTLPEAPLVRMQPLLVSLSLTVSHSIRSAMLCRQSDEAPIKRDGSPTIGLHSR